MTGFYMKQNTGLKWVKMQVKPQKMLYDHFGTVADSKMNSFTNPFYDLCLFFTTSSTVSLVRNIILKY